MIATPLPLSSSPALFVLLVGSGIALNILALNFVLAFASGWRGLAGSYQAGLQPRDGIRFRTTDNPPFFGLNGGQGVDAMLTPRGVYLTARFMRRPFHPPLLLPWPHFGSMAVESDLFTQIVTLEFADPAGRGMRFSLPKAAIPVIRKMSGQNDFSGEVLR